MTPMLPPFSLRALAAGIWLPDQASAQAAPIDRLFWFIMAISAFFFLLILATLVTFAVRFRSVGGDESTISAASPAHNNPLELTWTLIPVVIVLLIFYQGFKIFMQLSVPPGDAYRIVATGRMWSWSFAYPGGAADNELHLPRDTDVSLVLESPDVIHSLSIPAFRLRMDAVPGRYNQLWFRPDRVGTFDLYCSEYCGTNHSQMLTRVIVHEPEEFRRWLSDAGKWEGRITPIEAGRQFYERRGCAQCHSTDGSRLIGPSFKNLYSSTQHFTDGTSAVVDDAYVRGFIVDPQKRIPVGYDPVMPSFKGQFNPADLGAIVEFIKSLSDGYVPAPPPRLPASTPVTKPSPTE